MFWQNADYLNLCFHLFPPRHSINMRFEDRVHKTFFFLPGSSILDWHLRMCMKATWR